MTGPLAEAAARGMTSLALRRTATGAWDCMVQYDPKTGIPYGHSVRANAPAALLGALADVPSAEGDVFS